MKTIAMLLLVLLSSTAIAENVNESLKDQFTTRQATLKEQRENEIEAAKSKFVKRIIRVAFNIYSEVEEETPIKVVFDEDEISYFVKVEDDNILCKAYARSADPICLEIECLNEEKQVFKVVATTSLSYSHKNLYRKVRLYNINDAFIDKEHLITIRK